MLYCSNAVVQVELKNQGEDAFKPEIYGDIITVERRISGATSATVLKDKQGLNFKFLCLYNFVLLSLMSQERSYLNMEYIELIQILWY